MLIPCPFCGSRDASEFIYLGDASLAERPDGADAETLAAHVYLRDNPVGDHRELWYHNGGCRSWLKLVRDTRDHTIRSAEFVRPLAKSGTSS